MEEIVDLLRSNQVVVVAGETGSGKTTQLPKACLAAGLGRLGAIAHTQPRRLAARTVAARIAEELGVELGREVGYAVRFADRTSPETVVKVMTDGLLLNEIQRDRKLRRYECVIVDEAHERSLNVDFILGCLKYLIAQRRDLKVIVTSATIDVQAFAEHFGNAPVVEVSGRGHPVQTIHHPATENAEAGLVDCLETIVREAPVGRRDILVFQSGEREIFDNAQLLKRTFADRLEVLPLYARLPASEQQRVFAPGGRQRIVLATNVAETSITVPNIGYVVDPGFARISRYSYRAKLQRLPVERISQASAAQRAGRCGRIAPGVCYRLYDEEDFASRPEYTDPELKRSNLASVVLTMRAFRLGDIERFPFIDPPDARAVRDAVRLLHELQALEDDDLTPLGRKMARLPVDPRLARMLVEAARTGALAEALIVVSALASQDPRLRPLDQRDAADAAHAEFERPSTQAQTPPSDFVVYLNLWRWLEETRAEQTRSAFRRTLEKRFLSAARVREWHSLHRQLLLACRDLGLKANQTPADYATLHRALLAGSLGFIGLRRDSDDAAERRPRAKQRRRAAPEYDGARGLRFRIFPGSALRRSAPRWTMAAEIGDSGQTWARCVAAVEPQWIEAAAKHIAKSSFSEPRWDEARGEAVVLERVTVYGLPVAVDRPRSAAQADPEAARQLFVREVLLRRERSPKHRLLAPFLEHNEQLLQRVEERQARGRRSGLVASDAARAQFYLARLPPQVCSVATWQRFARRATTAQLAQFEMSEADLLGNEQAHFSAEDFPTRLHIGELTIPLAYKFAPGEPDDGVSARIDLPALQQLDADALDWLVPGFFEEKCLALVKALPKSWRRQLAPAPDRVRRLLPHLLEEPNYRQGPLPQALSVAIRTSFGIDIPADAWRPGALPPHLRMNVQLLRDDGRKTSGASGKRRIIDQDRDIAALRNRSLAKVERAISDRWRHELERSGLVRFPEAGVPDTQVVRGATGSAVVFPVLVDRGTSVDLLVHAQPNGRAALNRGGYARLALLADTQTARRLRREAERALSRGARGACPSHERALSRGARGACPSHERALSRGARGACPSHERALSRGARGACPSHERDATLGLHYAPLGTLSELADDILLAAAWFACFEDHPLPVTPAEFDARIKESKLTPTFATTLAQTKRILCQRFELTKALAALVSPAFAPSRTDMTRQLERLVGPGFLRTASSTWLHNLPRYLDAIAYRIANLQGRVAKDRVGIEAVTPWEARLEALREATANDAAADLQHLVEEFRIATFSQPIGTAMKVSAKRLAERFEAAEALLAKRSSAA